MLIPPIALITSLSAKATFMSPLCIMAIQVARTGIRADSISAHLLPGSLLSSLLYMVLLAVSTVTTTSGARISTILECL